MPHAGHTRIYTTLTDTTFRGIGQALVSFSSTLDEMNQFVRRTQYVNKSLAQSRLAFEQEKSALNASISTAERKLKLEEILQDKEVMNYCNKNYENVINSLDLESSKSESQKILRFEKIIFVRPTGIDFEMEAHVQHAFNLLQSERTRFFSDVTNAIQAEPRLGKHVFSYLRELGREDIWLQLGCPTSPISYK